MSIIKTKKRDNKCWQANEKEPLYTVGGNVNWYSNMKNSMRLPQ